MGQDLTGDHAFEEGVCYQSVVPLSQDLSILIQMLTNDVHFVGGHHLPGAEA